MPLTEFKSGNASESTENCFKYPDTALSIMPDIKGCKKITNSRSP